MNKFIKIAVTTAFLMSGFVSCKKENTSPDSKPVEVKMQSIILTGTVRNISGTPLGGVRIVSGDVSTTTDDDGTFGFEQAGTVNDRIVIRFEKQGYFDLVRSGVKVDEIHIDAVMQAKNNSSNSSTTIFDAVKDKTLSAGGLKVDISASSLVRSDGLAYTGLVNADLLYLDPDNIHFTELMPGGDLVGMRANNSETQLISYGMTEILLTDATGKALQLKNGATAGLTFPIPASMTNNPPNTIPLWSFDEERGIWIEEGAATLTDNDEYIGTVTHFSWYNLDVPAGCVVIRGTVTDCNGAPVPYVRVTAGQMAFPTNSKGEYRLVVPSETSVTVTVRSSDYGNYSPEASYYMEAKTSGTSFDHDISLPCLTQEPGELPIDDLDKGSVTYVIGDLFHIITFDNNGKRIRWDEQYETENHKVIVYDDISRSYFMSSGTSWFDLESSGADFIFNTFFFRNELYLQPGMEKLPDETIAGKLCTVIKFSAGDCYIKYAEWSGLLMKEETCNGVAMTVTDVSSEVPANAFTKTMDIFD
ncbi:MAG: carboxypeptidase-like regulatory domain-containing protein [Prevotellaceae bacterium]|jgi:hypothetical protein|nr:carboxypeptidase-like regulatory domain-containing protein [Prevotellaceae bacterium]